MGSSDKITDISTVAVSASVLADIIGVSDRRIRQLAEEGILIKVGHGRYNLQDSLQAYILNLRVEMEAGKDKPATDEVLGLEQEKAIHENVKRHMSELKLHLMKGNMHRSEDVEAVMTDMLLNFKTKILSLPSKLTPRLVNRQDEGFILDTLTEELNLVLEELSEYNPAVFYSKEYILQDGDEDGEIES